MKIVVKHCNACPLQGTRASSMGAYPVCEVRESVQVHDGGEDGFPPGCPLAESHVDISMEGE